MNGILIAVAIVYVLTIMTQGINFMTILCLISSGLFMSRKIGHFCKMSTLIGLEITGWFLDLMYKWMFHKINWATLIIGVLLRLVFFCIVYYDMTKFIYVKEKHRKGEKEDMW